MIPAQEFWDDTWESLEGLFRRMADSVRDSAAGTTLTCGRSSNEVFPFRCYASFGSGTKTLDVSIDIRLAGEDLLIGADIAREEGFVLFEVPEARVSTQMSAPEVARLTREALDRIEQELEGQTSLIAAEMS